MKKLLLTFLIIGTCVANAQIEMNTELANIETEMDSCKVVIATNKLIQLGDAGVGQLTQALASESTGVQSKWSVAMALGQIGNKRALSALESTVATTDNAWLKMLSQDAISMIKGDIPREGKIYVYSFGVKKTKIDCEAGKAEIIP